MRTIYTIAAGAALCLALTTGCQKDVSESATETESGVLSRSRDVILSTNCSSSSPYNFGDVDVVKQGCNYVWTWAVNNPNPGNGVTGAQNLSHWGFRVCEDFTTSHIVSAYYRIGGDPSSLDFNDLANWTALPYALAVDRSQSCETGTVLKFDIGTSGTTTTYYRLVLNANFEIASNTAYYKSGNVTGCCTFTYANSIGCLQAECLYSQGYWFARPSTIWGTDVTFGSLTITQQQGRTIWDSNQGNQYDNNNSVAKRALYQASAIQLSLCNVNSLPADVLAAYTTVSNFLSGLTYNDILTGDYDPNDYTAIASAVGVLGSHIDANHCDED